MTMPPNWLNTVVLAALLIALYMNWSWPWGLLFIYWAAPAIRSGEAFLIGPISRAQAPLLFYTVTLLWALLGAMMIVADIAPHLVNNSHAVAETIR